MDGNSIMIRSHGTNKCEIQYERETVKVTVRSVSNNKGFQYILHNRTANIYLKIMFKSPTD